jgi:HD-GYP domain-containing protein (c-di-GMP phosphodiesterase class II)
VDVYDALTSDRPYRKALSVADAIHELERETGRTLDGDVVQAFLAARRPG